MSFFKKLFGKKESSDIQRKQEIPSNKFVNLKTKGDENFKIASCLSPDDFAEYAEAELQAAMQDVPTFTYPKEKWEKAIAERKRRAEYEHLLSRVAALNNQGIELEEQGDIAGAIRVYEENVSLGYAARHAYDRLMILCHKQEDKANEERILKLAIEMFPDETMYRKRLAVLQGTFVVKPITKAPSLPTIDKCWGKLWEERILEVPEFDFYCEQESNPDKYTNLLHNSNYLEPVWEVQRHFRELLEEAKEAEDLGNQEQAVTLYEQAVAEKYYMPTPYDRLIKIYSKAKLAEEEKRILLLGIQHFTQLRDKRRAYILYLAQKYNATDFAMERIHAGKKITYYNGVFELYNPFPIVEKWKERAVKKHFLQET